MEILLTIVAIGLLFLALAMIMEGSEQLKFHGKSGRNFILGGITILIVCTILIIIVVE
jgi:hypothetical protein